METKDFPVSAGVLENVLIGAPFKYVGIVKASGLVRLRGMGLDCTNLIQSSVLPLEYGSHGRLKVGSTVSETVTLIFSDTREEIPELPAAGGSSSTPTRTFATASLVGATLYDVAGASSVDLILTANPSTDIQISRSMDGTNFELASLVATRENAMRFNSGKPDHLAQVGVKVRFDVTGCQKFRVTPNGGGTFTIKYALNYNVPIEETPFFALHVSSILGSGALVETGVQYRPRGAKGLAIYANATLAAGGASVDLTLNTYNAQVLSLFNSGVLANIAVSGKYAFAIYPGAGDGAPIGFDGVFDSPIPQAFTLGLQDTAFTGASGIDLTWEWIY